MRPHMPDQGKPAPLVRMRRSMKHSAVTGIALALVLMAVSVAILYGFAYTGRGAYEALSENRREDALTWLILFGLCCQLLFGSTGRSSS